MTSGKFETFVVGGWEFVVRLRGLASWELI